MVEPYFQDNKDLGVTIYCGEALEVLRELPDGSVNCCVTSPPYFGLRDYGTATWSGGDPECDHKSAKEKSRYDYKMQEGSRHEELSKTTEGTDGAKWKNACPTCGAIKADKQLGLEKSPNEYVAKLVEVFMEVRRVLRDDGTLWLVIGDSYSKGGGNQVTQTKVASHGLEGMRQETVRYNPKQLMGIPWRVAFGLQADGWYLRSDIIWSKPNPLPESVTDRPTKSHEYIFLLSKKEKYYYDAAAIAERAVEGKDLGPLRGKIKSSSDKIACHAKSIKDRQDKGVDSRTAGDGTRNKRSVWTVPTKPYAEAHFATFPPRLIKPCIMAGCPPGGVVLDPFGGSGTTMQVAKELGVKGIMIDISKKYCVLASDRLRQFELPFQYPSLDLLELDAYKLSLKKPAIDFNQEELPFEIPENVPDFLESIL